METPLDGANPFYFLDPYSRQQLIAGREQQVHLSLDLWKTSRRAHRRGNFLQLSENERLPLPPDSLLKRSDERTILIWRGRAWEKWQYQHPQTGRVYKPVFVAEGKPPTVELSGIKMHVTHNGDPTQDTWSKLKALGTVRGRVLDSCTGLGYSAIALAGRVGNRWVLTVESDPVMVQICRENPWSRALFELPNLSPVVMDAAVLVTLCPDAYLAGILHDPPRFSLAPELYSLAFYRQCYRILRSGGRLYHYTGAPGRRRGQDLQARTAARLKQAGFSRVLRCYQGVCARKG